MAPETHRSGILTAGGVLAIISGVLAIIVGVVLVILGILGASGWGLEAIPGGILAIILGLLAIVGGRHALARDRFGWALAGGIASLLCTGLWGIGILALIFIAIKKAEFEPSRRAAEERDRQQVIATRRQTTPAAEEKDSRQTIVMERRWLLPIGWMGIGVGILGLLAGLGEFLADSGAPALPYVGLGIGLVAIPAGNLIVCRSHVKITFFPSLGYMTVAPVLCPLRFLPPFRTFRTKSISREEARSVRVRFVQGMSWPGGFMPSQYLVMVQMRSGKEVLLWQSFTRDSPDYLARRILEFSQQ